MPDVATPADPHRLSARDVFDAIPISVRRIDQSDLLLHSHDFKEIVLVISGTAVHIVGDTSYPIRSGECFCIREGQDHGYRSTRDLKIVNILFREEDVLRFAPRLSAVGGYQAFFHLEPEIRGRDGFGSLLRLSNAETAELQRILIRLQEEILSRRDGYDIVAVGLLTQVLVLLSRTFAAAKETDSQILVNVGNVISHIEHNYGRSMALEELCEAAGMSRRSLIRHCKRATGLTPIRYLKEVRLRQVCSLLETTALNVTEIADRSGFSDSNYLAREFRRYAGASPTEFRKRREPLTS